MKFFWQVIDHILNTRHRNFREWCLVPPPNWNCSRRRLGGDYW